MPGFKRYQAGGTVIDPMTTTVNFAGMSASKSGDVTTLTVSGAESVTVQTATTSVLTPLVDAIAAGALAIGTTTATSISLNQTCNLAANKNLACAAGTTAVDLSLGTGTFKSTTGAHTINGSVSLAANKGIACAAGSGSLDFSLSTGAFNIGGASATIGFYGHAPIALQTGVSVDAAGIHAALVALGLITA